MNGRSSTAEGGSAVSTPLQRQLSAGPGAPRSTPLDALALGEQWFREGRRIDIQALAGELNVSRVTVHRWVGTREQFLVEILWSVADRALARLARTVADEDVPGSHTADILSRWAADVIAHPGIRRMQDEEVDTLARILTRDASEFQRRVIERVGQFLDADFAAGRITIDLTTTELAYAVVRLVESFVHTPAITGDAPAPDRNARVLRALLR